MPGRAAEPQESGQAWAIDHTDRGRVAVNLHVVEPLLGCQSACAVVFSRASVALSRPSISVR
jgi:hypothetical protein